MTTTNYPNGVSSFGIPVLAPGGNLPVSGSYYFVDGTTGADGNEGSSSSPKASITGALGSCVANNGDVIVVRAGIYSEVVTTAKALSLVSSGALWAMPSNQSPALVVTGLGAGKSLVLAGFTIGIEPGGSAPATGACACAPATTTRASSGTPWS